MFKRNRFLIGLVLLVALAYALTMKGAVGNPLAKDLAGTLGRVGQPFESSQERDRYLLAENIWNTKSFKLDSVAAIALPDVSFKDGHYYSVFPPGVSLVILPAFILGQFLGEPVVLTFLVPVLCAILTTVFVYLLGRRITLSKAASFVSALTFSLASFSWNYSITLYAHAFSALCLVAGSFFAFKVRRGSSLNYIPIWILFGLAILIDYPNALIMLPVIAFVIIDSFHLAKLKDSKKVKLNWRPEAFVSCVFFALFLLVLVFYNLKTFGSWSALANSYRVTNLVGSNLNYNFTVKQVLDFKYTENGLKTLLFSFERGIFFYAPVLLLSIFGLLGRIREQRRFIQLACAIVIMNLIVYSSFYDPWGGWSYGPRYLIVSLPFLSLLLGIGFDRLKSKVWYLVSFLFLFLVSSAIALLGVLTTNLIPPSAETGRDVFAPIYVLKHLNEIHPGSLVFNLTSRVFPSLNIFEYGGAILLIILISLTPVVLKEYLSHRKSRTSFSKEPILTVKFVRGEEANVSKTI